MAVVRAYIEDGYINKRGVSPVYVSFYIAREKVVVPCKISVPKEAWDNVAGKVTTKDKNHGDHNLIINETKSRINNILVKHRLTNVPITKQLFLREFNNPVDFSSFYDFVKFYQKIRFQEIEHSTSVYHQCVIRKLRHIKTISFFRT